MNKFEMVRQGDVLLVKVNTDKLPKQELTPIPLSSRGAVLALGEVTGHSHVVESHDVEFFDVPSAVAEKMGREILGFRAGDKILTVKDPKGVSLNHEEHATIKLTSGNWLIRIQREYDEVLHSRNVAD